MDCQSSGWATKPGRRLAFVTSVFRESLIKVLLATSNFTKPSMTFSLPTQLFPLAAATSAG